MARSLTAKPELELPLTEAHYKAIEYAAAQWAYVEREIDAEIAWLATVEAHH